MLNVVLVSGVDAPPPRCTDPRGAEGESLSLGEDDDSDIGARGEVG